MAYAVGYHLPPLPGLRIMPSFLLIPNSHPHHKFIRAPANTLSPLSQQPTPTRHSHQHAISSYKHPIFPQSPVIFHQSLIIFPHKRTIFPDKIARF